MTVSEIADNYQPVAVLHVPSPISWADEERDLTAWMGNELQTAAVSKLYSLSDRVARCGSDQLIRDWVYLQSSDHFYYMSTKFFSDGAVHAYFNPYENPYQAFMNYMNVLSDFEIRLNIVCPVNDHDEEVSRLSASIETKDHLISELQEKLTKYEKKVRTARPKAAKVKAGRSTSAAVKKAVALKEPAKKAALQTPAKKAIAKKTAPKTASVTKTAPKTATVTKTAPKKVTAKKTVTKSVRARKTTR
jgi:alpha-amylase